MHKATRNREIWINMYGEQFQSIWNDDSLTNDEKVIHLNMSNIPTLHKKLGAWNLQSCYYVDRKCFQ